MAGRNSIQHVIARSVQHALTIRGNGPPTERSPQSEGAPKAREASGTFRIGTLELQNPLQSYLLDEARHKAASACAVQVAILSLQTLSCPSELLEGARAVAEEKLRHASALAAAARRPEIFTLSAAPSELALLDLFEFARENGLRRCVSETYAAVRFAYQAEEADTPELAQIFAAIAREDREHAAYFWELQDWALSQLSPARARSIAAEQQQLRLTLRQAVEVKLPTEVLVYAGVPAPDASHAILDALEFQLWDREQARVAS